MNFLDKFALPVVNGYAGHSVAADKAIAFLSNYHLLKGGVLVVLILVGLLQSSGRSGAKPYPCSGNAGGMFCRRAFGPGDGQLIAASPAAFARSRC